MARKLRFFKEQMLKAGLTPSGKPTGADINIDDLEVCKASMPLLELNC